MKLNDLDNKNYATKALKESFEMSFDISTLDKLKTKTMLKKVTNLIKEAKESSSFYKNQTSPSYMKLVFMEQALISHYLDLNKKVQPKIVVENEEVAKSQVILAAQDMVDTVQKMLEDVNDMMVKELPALVSSIQSDIGANESQQFNAKANEALEAINVTLQSSKATLEGALGTITGQAPVDSFVSDDDMSNDLDQSSDDLDLDLDTPEGDLELDADLEEPESAPTGVVGRAKR